MDQLTRAQILIILDLISEKHGPGYSNNHEIGVLQAKLSIMLATTRKTEETGGSDD